MWALRLSIFIPVVFWMCTAVWSKSSLVELLVWLILHEVCNWVVYAKTEQKFLLLIPTFIMFRIEIRQDTCQIRSFYSVFSHRAIHLLMLCKNCSNKRLLDCWNVLVSLSFFSYDLCGSFLLIYLNILLHFLFEHILSQLFFHKTIEPLLR